MAWSSLVSILLHVIIIFPSSSSLLLKKLQSCEQAYEQEEASCFSSSRFCDANWDGKGKAPFVCSLPSSPLIGRANNVRQRWETSRLKSNRSEFDRGESLARGSEHLVCWSSAMANQNVRWPKFAGAASKQTGDVQCGTSNWEQRTYLKPCSWSSLL